MMKKTIITIGLSSIIALTGCADKDKDQGLGAKNNAGNPTNVNNPTQYYDEDYRNNDNKSDDFGFTRTNSATIDGRNISNKAASIDREQLSDVMKCLSYMIPMQRIGRKPQTRLNVLPCPSCLATIMFMSVMIIKPLPKMSRTSLQ